MESEFWENVSRDTIKNIYSTIAGSSVTIAVLCFLECDYFCEPKSFLMLFTSENTDLRYALSDLSGGFSIDASGDIRYQLSNIFQKATPTVIATAIHLLTCCTETSNRLLTSSLSKGNYGSTDCIQKAVQHVLYRENYRDWCCDILSEFFLTEWTTSTVVNELFGLSNAVNGADLLKYAFSTFPFSFNRRDIPRCDLLSSDNVESSSDGNNHISQAENCFSRVFSVFLKEEFFYDIDESISADYYCTHPWFGNILPRIAFSRAVVKYSDIFYQDKVKKFAWKRMLKLCSQRSISKFDISHLPPSIVIEAVCLENNESVSSIDVKAFDTSIEASQCSFTALNLNDDPGRNYEDMTRHSTLGKEVNGMETKVSPVQQGGESVPLVYNLAEKSVGQEHISFQVEDNFHQKFLKEYSWNRWVARLNSLFMNRYRFILEDKIRKFLKNKDDNLQKLFFKNWKLLWLERQITRAMFSRKVLRAWRKKLFLRNLLKQWCDHYSTDEGIIIDPFNRVILSDILSHWRRRQIVHQAIHQSESLARFKLLILLRRWNFLAQASKVVRIMQQRRISRSYLNYWVYRTQIFAPKKAIAEQFLKNNLCYRIWSHWVQRWKSSFYVRHQFATWHQRRHRYFQHLVWRNWTNQIKASRWLESKRVNTIINTCRYVLQHWYIVYKYRLSFHQLRRDNANLFYVRTQMQRFFSLWKHSFYLHYRKAKEKWYTDSMISAAEWHTNVTKKNFFFSWRCQYIQNKVNKLNVSNLSHTNSIRNDALEVNAVNSDKELSSEVTKVHTGGNTHSYLNYALLPKNNRKEIVSIKKSVSIIDNIIHRNKYLADRNHHFSKKTVLSSHMIAPKPEEIQSRSVLGNNPLNVSHYPLNISMPRYLSNDDKKAEAFFMRRVLAKSDKAAKSTSLVKSAQGPKDNLYFENSVTRPIDTNKDEWIFMGWKSDEISNIDILNNLSPVEHTQSDQFEGSSEELLIVPCTNVYSSDFESSPRKNLRIFPKCEHF